MDDRLKELEVKKKKQSQRKKTLEKKERRAEIDGRTSR